MTKYYMMKVSREGVQLYGGRQEDKGSYTVFEDRNLKTVEEFCDINVTDSDKEENVIGTIFSASYTPRTYISTSWRNTMASTMRRWAYTAMKGMRALVTRRIHNYFFVKALDTVRDGGFHSSRAARLPTVCYS